jgi:hypothetical protein
MNEVRKAPEKGSIFKNIKNEHYQVIDIAKQTNTGESLVIYKALFGSGTIYASPYDLFMNEVDHNIFPGAEQKYVMEYVRTKKNHNVITLCGSTKFKAEFERLNKELTLKGNVVISLGTYEHSGDSEVWEGMEDGTYTKTKLMLDEMHLQKIDMCDQIMVVNVGGYIGESTANEIEYAKLLGKDILYLEERE